MAIAAVEVEIKEVRDRNRFLLAQRDMMSQAYAELERQSEREIKESEEEIESARMEADIAERHLRELLDNQEHIQLLDNLVQQHAREVANKDRIIARRELQIDSLHRLVSQRDTTIVSLQEEIRHSESLVRHWEREANPGFFGSLTRNKTLVVVTAAAVVIAVIK